MSDIKVFAVCDTEQDYAKRLSERMKRESKIFEQIQVFGTPDAVFEYHEKAGIDGLIISESFIDADISDKLLKSGISKIYLLSSERNENTLMSEYTCIYKYQAASEVIKKILHASENIVAVNGMGNSDKKRKTEVIGVFSPVHFVEKSIWALIAGLIIAKERRTLYLNMERYAGFGEILGEKHDADLSEVFYSVMNGQNISFENYKGLSYAAPVRFSQEFDGMPPEEIYKCVEKIVEMADENKIAEKTVILDFSGSSSAHLQLCGLCEKIFLMQRNDSITMASVAVFEKECSITLRDDLQRKLKKVFVYPLREYAGEKFLEMNMEGEFGKTVREELKKEGLFD